jgi:hypothetical protein
MAKEREGGSTGVLPLLLLLLLLVLVLVLA